MGFRGAASFMSCPALHKKVTANLARLRVSQSHVALQHLHYFIDASQILQIFMSPCSGILCAATEVLGGSCRGFGLALAKAEIVINE